MVTTTTPRSSFRDRLLQTLGILGFIVILVLGAWGIIRIVTALPSIFSGAGGASPLTSLFGNGENEELALTSPTGTITAGIPFTLAWKHTGGSGNFAYAAAYDCHDGFIVAAQLPNGAFQPVPCNTPFNFINASSSMLLVTSLQGTKSTGVTFTVSATTLDTGAVTVSGQHTVTVEPNPRLATSTATTTKPTATTTPAKTEKPKSGSTYTSGGRASNPNGYTDIAVRIVSTGSMDPYSGSYFPNTSIAQGQRAGVQFIIENIGTKTAPQGWNFTAALPTSDSYVYTSAPQQALGPGDKIVYTMGFDFGPGGYNQPCYNQPPVYGTGQVYYGNNNCNQYGRGSTNFVLTADPYGYVYESNRTNNTASINWAQGVNYGTQNTYPGGYNY